MVLSPDFINHLFSVTYVRGSAARARGCADLAPGMVSVFTFAEIPKRAVAQHAAHQGEGHGPGDARADVPSRMGVSVLSAPNCASRPPGHCPPAVSDDRGSFSLAFTVGLVVQHVCKAKANAYLRKEHVVAKMNQLTPTVGIPVRFLEGDGHTDSVTEGNNAAWRCICNSLVICRTANFGKPCYVICKCDRVYRLEESHTATVAAVIEMSQEELADARST